MVLQKAGFDECFSACLAQDPMTVQYLTESEKGKGWGDIWYDNALREQDQVKKELAKIYIDMALTPTGRWRLGKKKIELEARYMELQNELGHRV